MRVKDAIVMEGSTLEKHSVVLNSIVGTNCHIGHWARVDGTPEPEQDVKGQISVTVLGRLIAMINADDQLPRSRLPPRLSSGVALCCQMYVHLFVAVTVFAYRVSEISREELGESSLALEY